MFRIVSANGIAEAAYAASVFALFFLTRSTYLAFIHRRSSHGRVFNSITGKPEALAAIALRDLHGSVVRSTVTDREGRYRLVAPRGEYILEVRKFGFSYPSQVVKGKQHPDFENILNTAHIIISDYGSIVKNIPIDPVSVSKNAFHFPRLVLPKSLQFLLIWLSPFLAYAAAYVIGSLLAWLIFLAYAAALINRVLHFKPAKPPYGTITDAEGGYPLEGVAVRVLEKKFNKVLETQVTSPKGRYAFVVNKGSYRILMKKPGYRGVMLNFNGVIEDGHLLATNVKMTRSQKKEEEEPQEDAALAPTAMGKVGDL